MGLVAGRNAGKAQAKGVLEGIERQLAGDREFALWSARREAFAAFLSTIEHLRVTFNHAVGLVEAHYVEGRDNASEERATKEALLQQHNDLRLTLATLRLSVDSGDVDEAEVLTDLASQLITAYDDYVDSFSGGRFDSSAFFRSEVELKERIAAWATTAGHRVQEGPARAAGPQVL